MVDRHESHENNVHQPPPPFAPINISLHAGASSCSALAPCRMRSACAQESTVRTSTKMSKGSGRPWKTKTKHLMNDKSEQIAHFANGGMACQNIWPINHAGREYVWSVLPTAQLCFLQELPNNPNSMHNSCHVNRTSREVRLEDKCHRPKWTAWM